MTYLDEGGVFQTFIQGEGMTDLAFLWGYLALFVAISLSACAQVLQKLAASRTQPALSTRILPPVLYNPFFLMSLACLGLSMLLWLVVLSILPVSQAYPMMSLGYVLVMLLARYLFKERVAWQRWLGVGLIILGVSCLIGAEA